MTTKIVLKDNNNDKKQTYSRKIVHGKESSNLTISGLFVIITNVIKFNKYVIIVIKNVRNRKT